jgi:hypothetical protein
LEGSKLTIWVVNGVLLLFFDFLLLGSRLHDSPLQLSLLLLEGQCRHTGCLVGVVVVWDGLVVVLVPVMALVVPTQAG